VTSIYAEVEGGRKPNHYYSNSYSPSSIYILQIVIVREVLVHLRSVCIPRMVWIPWRCYMWSTCASRKVQEEREQLHNTTTLDAFICILPHLHV
jgi:hypothetical protein